MKDAARCPYCISGVEFRRMIAHVDGRSICSKCGHTTCPGNPEYQCHCLNCRNVEAVTSRLVSKQRPDARN